MSSDEFGAEERARLEERFTAVRARVAAAAERAGRAPESVRLIAVSKTQPPAALRAAYAAGQRDFGENYVQELLAKAAALADLPDLRFHLIGHLQRNKVRQLVGHVSAIHSVDSVRLVEELAKRAAGARVPEARRWLPAGPLPSQSHPSQSLSSQPPSSQSPSSQPPSNEPAPLPVLVEVNVGGEASKSGCSPEELPLVLDAVEAAPALRLTGLMTVPPYTEDPAGSREFFEALVALRDRYGGAERLPELSMGMSHDVEEAIAAGSTLVRVGTALFGARPPKAP